MKFSIATILSLAAIVAANPFPAPQTATPIVGKVTIYDLASCGKIASVRSLPIDATDNQCYNAADTKFETKFLSILGYPDRPLEPNEKCQLKAYFEKDCMGNAVVTDNYMKNTCLRTDISPANPTTPIVGIKIAGVSFKFKCYKTDASGKTCED